MESSLGVGLEPSYKVEAVGEEIVTFCGSHMPSKWKNKKGVAFVNSIYSIY